MTVHFKVVLARSGQASQVLMDGEDISNKVRAIRISAGVHQPTTVELEVIATVEGLIEADVTREER